MENIVEELKAEIEHLKVTSAPRNVGTIVEVGDGIAKAEGLSEASYNELVELPKGL